MAAIISQMAANKRARQKGAVTAYVSSDKCVYTLPPFDPCFDPMVHNKYVRSMALKRAAEARRGEAGKRAEDRKGLFKASMNRSGGCRTCSQSVWRLPDLFTIGRAIAGILHYGTEGFEIPTNTWSYLFHVQNHPFLCVCFQF